MQPFVRGNSARTIQGSGLGLAIVKRIVDIHQGQISIRNREQGGLEVVISLPLNHENLEESQTNAIDKIKQTITGHF
jgi:two-component system osmolarity sensor histidine kinase EnvZ